MDSRLHGMTQHVARRGWTVARLWLPGLIVIVIALSNPNYQGKSKVKVHVQYIVHSNKLIFSPPKLGARITRPGGTYI